MKKSISLLLAAVMVFALAAIACADATTVTAWISDGAETVIYTSMFDDFNSKHDDIQVDYQFFAQDELLNKLQTAPIVGDTPDLIVIDGLQIPYFQDLGMIACLDNYIDEDMKNDVLPSVWSEVTYDGGLYGVAQFDSGMAMWTRKSILEKIGARASRLLTRMRGRSKSLRISSPSARKSATSIRSTSVRTRPAPSTSLGWQSSLPSAAIT